MTIRHYLKEIGRGKDGARALSRDQACDLMAQILANQISDLELGAFCVAMRIKGETAEEMAGFLDAIHQALPELAQPAVPPVVLPSYNGARRLPVLTPLLGLLLARAGLPVLIHGSSTETQRISSAQVLEALGLPASPVLATPAPGQLLHLHTQTLLPALHRLLEVRAMVGLRNPGHSLVKLLNPWGRSAAASLVIGCYTHPEYALSMAATHAEMGSHALLLRGTEGEPVADPRRQPAWQGLLHGQLRLQQPAQSGVVGLAPQLPNGLDVEATAAYTRAVLDGEQPLPASIAAQVQAIVELHRQLGTDLPARSAA